MLIFTRKRLRRFGLTPKKERTKLLQRRLEATDIVERMREHFKFKGIITRSRSDTEKDAFWFLLKILFDTLIIFFHVLVCQNDACVQ